MSSKLGTLGKAGTFGYQEGGIGHDGVPGKDCDGRLWVVGILTNSPYCEACFVVSSTALTGMASG